MILEIGDKLVSSEVLEQRFGCNLSRCKGCCCVVGVSGAPLESDEEEEIRKVYPLVDPLLSCAAREEIARHGLSVVDADGDLVTPLCSRHKNSPIPLNSPDISSTEWSDTPEANQYACVYLLWDRGIAKCAFEVLFLKGKISFRKPLSCHLYPIRITEYSSYDAVNYEQIEICRPGRENPAGLPVYQYLKEPLIRKYGEEWYSLLEQNATHWGEH